MSDLSPPSRRIGEYEFVHTLGTGAFAIVWLAHHRVTGLAVAIKVVLKSSLDSEEAVTRFAREISLLKAMNHPFVAELFEIIEDATSFYIVMELIEHGNMLEYVNGHGRLSEEQARRYFCEIISALDYLHNSRFVAHRDLKAENILLDRHNNIRLIDFGLSKQFSKGAPTLVTACGSPAYAAPEMIQGYSYTKAADIWSAGICLFAMVAGHLPFEDSNVEGLLQKVVSLEPDYPVSMSRGLVDFLKRLLCKSPNSRITIDRLKEHQWFSQCEYSVLIGFHTTVGGAGEMVPAIDRELVDQISSLGFDCKDLPRALLAREYSPLTAVYKQLRRYKLTDKMKDLLAKMAVSLPPTRILLTSLTPDPTVGYPRLPDARVRRRLTAAVAGLFEEAEERPPVRRMSRPIIVKTDLRACSASTM
jgi:tRNA A-37 threonylcarbamoyl transferase component Bud32